MKTYVTGAGGMIGSHLIEILHKKGYEVAGSYFHPTVDLRDIDCNGVNLFELDVRNHEKMAEWINTYLPDRIFHLAAQSFPVLSWDDPYYTVDVNVNGTIGLFEAIKTAKKRHPSYDPRVVVISSSAIYGEALLNYSVKNLPTEDCPMLPLHPYGVSKAAEDLLCYQYFRNFGIKTERVRLFNCTGTRKIGDITSDFTKRAVELEKANDNHLVVGNLTALRAIVDARDVCNGLIILSEKGTPGEPYNICSNHIFRMSHVVECIEHIMNTKFVLVEDPKLIRPADERLYAGNCDKIKALGWSEQFEYEDTVREMIEFWRRKIL
jgi:GDP-4-dehydro-6-deoxy-D-mannose reductase